MTQKKSLRQILGSNWGQKITILVIFVVVMAIFQRQFFLPANWTSILRAISIYGIMACGMFFVVLIGGLDLSVASTASLSATIVMLSVVNSGYAKGAFLKGFVIAMAVCVAIGLVHSFFVTRFKMPSFVVTLATKYALLGVVMLVSNSSYTYLTEDTSFLFKLGNTKLLSVPVPIIIFIVFAIVCALILNFTTFGRKLYAVGGNATASELVGIKSKRNTRIAFILCSMSAGIGGIILCSMNCVAGSGTASGYEGNVLMAMIVGGINLAGGEGGILDAVYGALLVGIINNVQILIGIPADYQDFVRGVIILAALSLNVYTYRKMHGMIPPRRKKCLDKPVYETQTQAKVTK